MEVQGNARWLAVLIATVLAGMLAAGSSGDTSTGQTTTTTTSGSTTTTSPTSSGIDYSYAGTVVGGSIVMSGKLKGFVDKWDIRYYPSPTDADVVTAIRDFTVDLSDTQRILRYAGFAVISDEERRVSGGSLNLANVQYLDQQHGFDFGALRSFERAEGFGVGLRYNASPSQSALRGAFQDLRNAVRNADKRLREVKERAEHRDKPADLLPLLWAAAGRLQDALDNLYARTYQAIYGLRVGLVADYFDIGGTRLAAEGAGIAKLVPVGTVENGMAPAGYAVPRFGVLLAGSVREIDLNQSGTHTSSRELAGTVAWQWTACQPEDKKSKAYTGINYSWVARVGAEFRTTHPRIGDDYTGVYIGVRPVHDIEVRLYARTTGRPSLFGARISVGIP